MDSSDENRTRKYKKDNVQENILKLMNSALAEKESELISVFDKPELPVIFIVGAQRSGSTLLMQLLIQHYKLSYPNNFISRYWDAPYIGAMLFKNLSSDLDINKLDLNSDLGYTKGHSGPHEFGYFWKKWFPFKSWDEQKYSELDYVILQKQLAAWESVNKTPLIFKNIIQVSFNIEKLVELFPNAFFIHIKRKPEYVAQSTYQSRKKLFGDVKYWMGLEPPEFKELKKLKVLEQICAQIYYSRRFIEKALINSKAKNITIDLESLIKNPTQTLCKIGRKINLDSKETEIPLLKNPNQVNLPDNEFNEIKLHCQKYFKNKL